MSSSFQRQQRKKELEEKRARLRKLKEAREAKLKARQSASAEVAEAKSSDAEKEKAAQRKKLFDPIAQATDLGDLLQTLETTMAPPGDSGDGGGNNVEQKGQKKRTVELTVLSQLYTFSLAPRQTVMYSRGVSHRCVESSRGASDDVEQKNRIDRIDDDDGDDVIAASSLEHSNADGSATTMSDSDANVGDGRNEGAEEAGEEDDEEAEEEEAQWDWKAVAQFLDASSKRVERAVSLNGRFDVITDYGGGDRNVSAAMSGPSSVRGVTLQTTLYDERWSKNRSVTSLEWSTEFKDLVAASYSANEGGSQDPDGVVLLWSAMNLLKRPEYVLTCQSPVVSTALNPFDASMVFGGTYSGQIVCWDKRSKSSAPARRTSLAALGGHSHPVFCLRVIGSANAHNLLSISTDGRVCVWRTDDLSAPIELMELHNKRYAPPPAAVGHATTATSKAASANPVASTCMAFADGETNSFLVGSEQGSACRVFRHGKQKGVESQFAAHFGPVTGIDMHSARGPHDFSHLFLTSSIDWSCKLWSQNSSAAPLHSFEDSSDYVSDIKWSPRHPALFASVDGTGTLRLWNLNRDTEAPVAKVNVSPHAINRLSWSSDGRLLLLGDSIGSLHLVDVGDHAEPMPDEHDRLLDTIQSLSSKH
jgi:dynein cytoplasmic 1 intermediate chain